MSYEPVWNVRLSGFADHSGKHCADGIDVSWPASTVRFSFQHMKATYQKAMERLCLWTHKHDLWTVSADPQRAAIMKRIYVEILKCHVKFKVFILK